MIDTLLKHLVALTGHRDQALLDASIIAAMQELAGATQVSTWDIFRFQDMLYMHKRAWLHQGSVISANENEFDDQTGELVSRYPELHACISAGKPQVSLTLADGTYQLWLPVWFNEKVTTCLELHAARPFTKRVMRVVEGMLDIYRNYQNLLDYSERDSLTGLLNRKTFDERFSRMVAVNAEVPDIKMKPDYRQPVKSNQHWLAVVDIDHFKKVNDQFGHLYGDEVLIMVANRLRSSFRAQDRVFRFGGEEFVILLRSSTQEDAHSIFERFRLNVEEHDFPQVGKVTVSVGFSSISTETPVVILGHADQALYYAKAHGRNRVCQYDELLEHGLLESRKSNESAEFFFDQPL